MRRIAIAPAAAAALLWLAGAPAPAAEAPAPASSAPEAAVERHSPKTGAPSLGPEKAANTLVFFTDYQCPVCPRAARELDRLVADFQGTLRVEVRHNPLVIHKDAFEAAAAAKAAQRQGKFWEYHAALVGGGARDRAGLLRLAQELKLDEAAFARDFDDPKLRDEIGADIKAAADAKALGTPGFLINGHVETGWASLPWLEQVVRAHGK
ncbi:MAG TPA: thioredoxin domain-containing protein [Candidatus Polarisedimenticolia bacterium]|nr:thioredoxin domain-containing protein [Candidatus Polarisedimenticolia bacterium]